MKIRKISTLALALIISLSCLYSTAFAATYVSGNVGAYYTASGSLNIISGTPVGAYAQTSSTVPVSQDNPISAMAVVTVYNADGTSSTQGRSNPNMSGARSPNVYAKTGGIPGVSFEGDHSVDGGRYGYWEGYTDYAY